MDQESCGETDADALQCRHPQCLTTVGDQIARYPHRSRRALAVNEMPPVFERIKDVAYTVMSREIGELLRTRMFFELIVRAAQDMPPGRKAADDQAGIRRRREANGNVVPLIDQVDASLAHGQINLDVGIALQEFGDDRREKRHDVSSRIDT